MNEDAGYDYSFSLLCARNEVHSDSHIIQCQWKSRTNSPKMIIAKVIRHSDEERNSRCGSAVPAMPFFLVLVTALFVSILGPDRSFSNLFLLWGLVAFWIFCIWYAPRPAAKKMIRGSPSASLPHTLEASENGLHFQTSASEGRLTWVLIIGWVEVDRVFAIMPSPLTFLPNGN